MIEGAASFLGGGGSVPSLTQNTRSGADATTGGSYSAGAGTFTVNSGGVPPWAYVALGGMALLGLVIFMRGKR